MPKFNLFSDATRDHVKKNIIDFMDKLPDSKQFQITIEPLKKERSLLQNKALFGLAYEELREQSGNEKNDLHDFFCGEFFGWQDYIVMGLRKKRPVRSTTIDENGKYSPIDTLQFSEFYAFIQRRSAENGFYVSDPDPMWRLKPDF